MPRKTQPAPQPEIERHRVEPRDPDDVESDMADSLEDQADDEPEEEPDDDVVREDDEQSLEGRSR